MPSSTKKMRFHVLGLPHTVTSKQFLSCAYTQKVVKFGKMMTDRGHTVIHYGHEESDLQCTEHVTVLTSEDWRKTYGDHDWRRHFFKYSLTDDAYKIFYSNAIREVGMRKQKHDFILPFWGIGTKPVCDAHPDLICVEPGIGYGSGHWADYKVFESYAIYHAYCGLKAVEGCHQNWYDVVIPNYFDLADFHFCDKEDKDDYFLFMGRVNEGKGIHIAIQVTEKIGAKLYVAGQCSLKEVGYITTPAHVTELGFANVTQRRMLMAKAKGAFVASIYVEPFGGVQVECLLSGTPTITTDWGAFAENNIHGVTGYRCRTFEHFLWAAENIGNIDPKACRAFAERNFCLERVALMYEEFFQSVLNVHTNKGWYEPNPDRSNLQWLVKHYPVSVETKDISTSMDPLREPEI
jgi:glycosyltransferase involved in cell wall biosynthesis